MELQITVRTAISASHPAFVPLPRHDQIAITLGAMEVTGSCH